MIEISEVYLDYIKEMFNIGVGRGADILNSMLNSHIKLNVPDIHVLDQWEDHDLLSHKQMVAAVHLPFKGPLTGSSKLLFPTESALKLVKEVSGNEQGLISESRFDPISEGVLKEVGNIVLNSVIGVLCNNLKIHLNYSVPLFSENPADEIVPELQNDEESKGILATIHFVIESIDVQGDVLTVFQMGSFKELLNLIKGQLGD